MLQLHPILILNLAAAAIAVIIAAFARRRRPAPGAGALTALMLGVAVWSLASSLGLLRADLGWQLFWANVAYVGVGLVPASWLLFALHHTGSPIAQRRGLIPLLAVEPLLVLLLAWSNEAHLLFRREVRLVESAGIQLLDPVVGPAFWAHALYAYTILAIGSVLLVRAAFRTDGLYRRQATALLIGVSAPWVANALYLGGMSPLPFFDLTPLSFTVSGLALAWDLRRLRLLDVLPVARDLLIEQMSDGVVVVDAQRRVVDLNPTAERTLGRAGRHAIGRPVQELFAVWPQLIERYAARDGDIAEELTIAGALPRTFDVRRTALFDRRGQLTGHLIVWRDISDRVRTETTLEQTAANLQARVDELVAINQLTQTISAEPRLPVILERAARSLVEQLDVGGAVVLLRDEAAGAFSVAAAYDRDPTAGCIVAATVPAAPLEQLSAAQPGGRPVLLTPAEIAALLPPLAAAPRARPVHCLLLAPLWHGALHGFVGVLNDQDSRQCGPSDLRFVETVAGQLGGVVERARLLEAAEQAREVAERANTAKSQFLGAMSHELRTPLNAILGYAQLLQHEPRLSEFQGEALRLIEQSGEHLLSLITDLLDLARIEAGRLELAEEPVMLPELLNDLAATGRLQAERKGLAFHYVVAEGVGAGPATLPALVRTDPRRLRQVLLNLIGNAVKFTDQGAITLTVRCGPLAGGRWPLSFRVDDTGIGILPADLTRIMEPFQQAGAAHRRAEGTGLGLAICRELLALLGSELQVQSEPGRGSSFGFALRLVPEAADDDRPLPASVPIAAGDPVAAQGPGTARGIAAPPMLPALATIATPSAEAVATLHDLLVVGDLRAIQQYVARLAEQEPELGAFAQDVRRLTNTFQLDALRTLLLAAGPLAAQLEELGDAA